jgi:calpain-7
LELKFKHEKRIISCNIYPQDSSGRPIYNPFGQYTIKLFINGCWRAVKIDDFFPVDSQNKVLCSFDKKGKLWASLLEKAYLKTCNGYDFCGSNTSRDLFIFTGWLPEKFSCKDISDPGTLWRRMTDGDARRDVMISISTGSTVG